MSTMEGAVMDATGGKMILNNPRHRRRKAAPENVVQDTPFVRVTPNGQQMSINRDALAALGHPTHVLIVRYGGKELGWHRVKLVSANSTTVGSYVISYARRSSAVMTVPREIRDVFGPKRFWATGWAKPTDVPKWIEFTIVITGVAPVASAPAEAGAGGGK